jgi:hypothetical protein
MPLGTSQEEQIPVHQKFTILWHTGSQILEKPQKTRPVRQDNANSCRTGQLSGFPIRSGYGITTPEGILN